MGAGQSKGELLHQYVQSGNYDAVKALRRDGASLEVPQPRTIISLARYEIEEPKFDTADPVLYITDKTSKMKYKYLSENDGDKTQLEKLYKVCRGITEAGVLPLDINGLPAAGCQPRNLPQILPKDLQRNEAPYPTRQPVWQSVSAPLPNPGAEHTPEKLALAMALDKSSRTATEEGIPLPQDGPNSSRVNYFKGLNVLDRSYKGWGLFDPKKQQKEPKERRHGRWEGEQSIDYGWGSAEQGPSRALNVFSNQEPVAALVTNPSAPPLPDDPVHYAMLDISQSKTENLTGPEDMKLLNANITADNKAGKSCVVCWDAPAEGVCIPCGHLAGCMKCLSEIKAKKWGCPVCREQIDQVVKVYMV